MDDSASLDKIADLFVPELGWYRCMKDTHTYLTFNTHLICENESYYPLYTRIDLFDGGKLIRREYIELKFGDVHFVDLNALIPGRDVKDGYFETTIFPSKEEGFRERYFFNLWATVLSDDGRININYPALLSHGDDAVTQSGNILLYPGIKIDENFTCKMVVTNHYDFENSFKIKIFSADGKNCVSKEANVPAKSTFVIDLESVMDNAVEFFKAGAGSVNYHAKYKMPGFVQTWQKNKQTLSGMDHLSFFYCNTAELATHTDAEMEVKINLSRLKDKIVCVCRPMTESKLKALKEKGLSISQIAHETGCGSVCHGCVNKMEKITGEIFELQNF